MKELEKIFTGKGEVSGVIFTQLFRFNDLCLYKRSDRCWEVMRIRQQKESKRIMDGKEVIYEEKEYYPKGEDWGKFEWACNTLQDAIQRYNEQAEQMHYNIRISESDLTQ